MFTPASTETPTRTTRGRCFGVCNQLACGRDTRAKTDLYLAFHGILALCYASGDRAAQARGDEKKGVHIWLRGEGAGGGGFDDCFCRLFSLTAHYIPCAGGNRVTVLPLCLLCSDYEVLVTARSGSKCGWIDRERSANKKGWGGFGLFRGRVVNKASDHIEVEMLQIKNWLLERHRPVRSNC